MLGVRHRLPEVATSFNLIGETLSTRAAHPVPQGHSIIARRFNAGTRVPDRASPAGTAETPRMRPFSRPSGAWLSRSVYPRLKPWAIVTRPSGTHKGVSPRHRRLGHPRALLRLFLRSRRHHLLRPYHQPLPRPGQKPEGESEPGPDAGDVRAHWRGFPSSFCHFSRKSGSTPRSFSATAPSYRKVMPSRPLISCDQKATRSR